MHTFERMPRCLYHQRQHVTEKKIHDQHHGGYISGCHGHAEHAVDVLPECVWADVACQMTHQRAGEDGLSTQSESCCLDPHANHAAALAADVQASVGYACCQAPVACLAHHALWGRTLQELSLQALIAEAKHAAGNLYAQQACAVGMQAWHLALLCLLRQKSVTGAEAAASCCAPHVAWSLIGIGVTLGYMCSDLGSVIWVLAADGSSGAVWQGESQQLQSWAAEGKNAERKRGHCDCAEVNKLGCCPCGSSWARMSGTGLAVGVEPWGVVGVADTQGWGCWRG